MSVLIEQMLKSYDVENIYDRKNAMKEIMQEIVLCGLSRAGFFKEATFYGGTALRIFYGLDRFSEDLDFSLVNTNLNFDLKDYFPVLEKEVRAFGLNVEIMEKDKAKESTIRSAFLKGNTKEHLLLFYADEQAVGSVAKNEAVKIKFEVPYELCLYDMPSLFAGKIHAVICRAWKNRIKGRDLYDYVFYLSKGTAFNQRHLRARLIDSGYIAEDEECSLDEIRIILRERFDKIDFSQARKDVEPFIRDTSVLDIWSTEFFKQITEGLKAI